MFSQRARPDRRSAATNASTSTTQLMVAARPPDALLCPAANGGTRVCKEGACVIGTCVDGTKKCGDSCVPTDKNNGCSDTARCSACAARETCGRDFRDRMPVRAGQYRGLRWKGLWASNQQLWPRNHLHEHLRGEQHLRRRCQRRGKPMRMHSEQRGSLCGQRCGPATNNCGQAITCPNTCGGGRVCAETSVGVHKCDLPLSWANSFKFDSAGAKPSIAIGRPNAAGQTGEADGGAPSGKRQAFGALWFRSGALASLGASTQYDQGFNPSLARHASDGLLEVHQGQEGAGSLWYRQLRWDTDTGYSLVKVGTAAN